MPPKSNGKTNVDYTMKYYTCRIKNVDKINLGLPFYGRYWKNVGGLLDNNYEMWRLANAVNGKFEGGFTPYNKIKNEFLNSSSF